MTGIKSSKTEITGEKIKESKGRDTSGKPNPMSPFTKPPMKIAKKIIII